MSMEEAVSGQAIQQSAPSSPTPDPPQAPATAVSAVSVKLPPFWPSDPLLWFAQVEAQFRTRHITQEETKFWHVVGNLDQKHANEVRDLLLAPPQTTPYTTLKHQLVDRLTASAHQRVRQLLSDEPLGDRKPTQFLRHLQHLQGDARIDSSILAELFLQRLPPSVRMVLATASSLSLEEQAKLADRVMDITPNLSTSSVNAVDTTSATGRSTLSEMSEQRAEIASLRAEVAQLSRPARPRSRSRGRSRSDHSRRQSSSPGRDSSGLCCYHRRFGSDARHCQQPCDFNNQSGNGPASQ